MEVHPPDHPVITWKQFFVHMAIVVLGLLIAIALEQSVEAMHHHEQARELREALQRETRQILDDQTAAVQNHDAVAAWGTMRRQQLYDGLCTYPITTLANITIVSYFLKVAYEIPATPLIYLVVNFLKRAENYDPLDAHTNFNPFKLIEN